MRPIRLAEITISRQAAYRCVVDGPSRQEDVSLKKLATNYTVAYRAMPMKALHALRTRKVIVEAGAWHNGKIPKAAFPLSHVKSHHKLAKTWHWCVHKVQDHDRCYRLLVAFEPGKRQYWAWLGAIYGEDQALLARVEFHATHDGWHCHWKTGEITEVARGAVKASFPAERRHQCSGLPLDVTRADAFGIAFRLFNVSGVSQSETML